MFFSYLIPFNFAKDKYFESSTTNAKDQNYSQFFQTLANSQNLWCPEWCITRAPYGKDIQDSERSSKKSFNTNERGYMLVGNGTDRGSHFQRRSLLRFWGTRDRTIF